VRPAAADVRAAVERVVGQIEHPLVDTWGCSLRGHVVTLAERLDAVSTAAQRIAENGPDCREDLVEQLAELAASAVVMLVEASNVFSSTTNESRRCTMNASAAARTMMNVDEALADQRDGARREQPTDDGDAVLFDTRGQQLNPLPTTMTTAEALEDSLGPRR
jgi:hypothetical protein